MLDDASDGLGYLVPADADGSDRIIVIEAEFLQGFVGLFNIFDFFNNPVKIFLYYFLKSHKSSETFIVCL